MAPTPTPISSGSRSRLRGLARRLDIAVTYTSAWGRPVAVPDSTIVSIIESLGISTTGRGWIPRASAAIDATEAAINIDPVLVAWDGAFDAAASFARVDKGSIVVRDEYGVDVTAVVLGDDRLPFGYYDIAVDATSALLISAPRHLPRPTARNTCVFAPLYALRPPDSSRWADLRELDAFVSWVGQAGGDGILTLPLLAGFFDHPSEPSPYAPASRSMWNELYAVVERPSVDAHGTFVDYDAAYVATRNGIENIGRAIDHDPSMARDYLQFLEAHPTVDEYARFRAAGEQHGRNWRQWPDTMRDGSVAAADIDPTRARYHSVGQWLIHTQLAEVARRARDVGISIGLDLAVGTHGDGFDVWAHQGLFACGVTVGAPPDAYFPGGQGWGFPPAHPERTRANGYRLFRAALRHHLSVATVLRLDHVMGLARLYWIPDGSTPDEGTYVHTNLDEHLAIVCLEAHRAGATIVGENLGIVPPEIEAARDEHHMLGISIAYGALEDPLRARAPLTASADTVAAFGTHDMATFEGFVHGDDLADRIALGLGDPADATTQAQRRKAAIARASDARGIEPGTDDLYRVLSRELANSEAPWFVVSLEDLWGERLPQNVPGTSTERPNWRRRAKYGLDEVPDRSLATLRAIVQARHTGGGAPDQSH